MGNNIRDLLDREIPADYRHEWTEHVAEEVVEAARTTESVVLFRVGAEWLSISTEYFFGIAEITPVHSLPQRRNSVVMGIADVRGELLICISLPELLGIHAGGAPQSTERFIILHAVGGPLAMPVQEVYGIHHYSHTELLEAPSTLANARNHYTAGVLRWNGQSVARLSEEKMFRTIAESLS